MESIGDRIRRLRGRRKQVDLAQSVGMRSTHWSQIETGHRPCPTVGTLRKIADALGVPLANLLDEHNKGMG